MAAGRKLNRRDFLRGSAVAAVGIMAASCAQPTPLIVEKEVPVEKIVKETVIVEKEVAVEKVVKETVVTEKEVAIEKVVTATPVPAKYKEAPMLAELVAAGKLPPVDERLPQDPCVLEPVESIGTYGGTWNFMSPSTNFNGGGALGMVMCENFMRWERDMSGHRPNVVKEWAWNADGTQITLTFRKGMKWSDGAPAGPDDWLFWWEDMILDDKINLTRQTGTSTGGVDMKAVKLDDYTLQLTFAHPNPLFVELMNRGTGNRATSWQFVPSHYLKQFHYKYTPAATDTTALLDHYNNRWDYLDMPTIYPMKVKEIKAGEFVKLERNPYYWKVDPEGNQLPYFDGFEVKQVKEKQLIALSCVAGEVDFQLRDIDLKDAAMFKENEAKGNYTLRMWQLGDANQAGILIRYCSPDKGMNELNFNQKWRMALSYAINKERINDIVFLGLGQVRAFAMMASGPEFASERGQKVLKDWETTYMEYDPELAKKLLDEIGVKDVNGDGWRERPDGSPLDMIIIVDVTDKYGIEAQQLIAEDYKAIGLKWTPSVIEGSLLSQKEGLCEEPFRARGGAASGLFVAPGHWTPVENNDYIVCGQPYGLWYQSGGKEGTPPPPEAPWMKELQDIFGEAILIVDVDKRNDRTLDGYQVHIDQGPFQIGTVGSLISPVIVKNTMKNVSETGIVGSWVWGFPGTIDPEQWYRGS